MKTPSFWYTPPGALSCLLSPLGWLYGKGAKLWRTLSKNQRFSVPIISVGGIVCGGSGKTPAAIAMAKLLQEKGYNVHIVTRGYKGRLPGPLEVKPHIHTAAQVGDEPLLLAQQARTWVAKKRVLGIEKAIKNKAELIILDDGHQTLGIYKDISFVVMDLLQGWGNGHVMPAGPLREDLKEGLSRADAIIGVGKGKLPVSKPLIKAEILSSTSLPPDLSVIAFCGLGFPEKFYHSLKKAGIKVKATKSFPDHYTYTEQDLADLQHLAVQQDAVLITTRKDWVRLSPVWKKKVYVLDIVVSFQDKEKLYDFIVGEIA